MQCIPPRFYMLPLTGYSISPTGAVLSSALSIACPQLTSTSANTIDIGRLIKGWLVITTHQGLINYAG
uniref:Uncharacterized protein n=1 Tax=Anguilla anguilla TaxID=7936 RepID=A0A0E9V2F0_ANGAN